MRVRIADELRSHDEPFWSRSNVVGGITGDQRQSIVLRWSDHAQVVAEAVTDYNKPSRIWVDVRDEGIRRGNEKNRIDGCDWLMDISLVESRVCEQFESVAEFLIGASHINVDSGSATDTSFANALGGGLDYQVAGPISIRGQLDWIHTRFFSDHQNDVRFATGVTFHF